VCRTTPIPPFPVRSEVALTPVGLALADARQRYDTTSLATSQSDQHDYAGLRLVTRFLRTLSAEVPSVASLYRALADTDATQLTDPP
jgi:hypothetical protein